MKKSYLILIPILLILIQTLAPAQDSTYQIHLAPGAVVDAGGTLTIAPAPGYRETWFYWGGKWVSEWDWMAGATGGHALVSLNYFRDDNDDSAWIDRLEMSPERFQKLDDLADCDSLKMWKWDGTGAPKSFFIFMDRAGHMIGSGPINFEFVKARLLWAILQSRKQ